jgi:hypothetical protein
MPVWRRAGGDGAMRGSSAVCPRGHPGRERRSPQAALIAGLTLAAVTGVKAVALAQCREATGSAIAGRVVDRGGAPVAHADVIVAVNGEDKTLCHFVAGLDGRFSATVKPGAYRVEVSTYLRGERPLARVLVEVEADRAEPAPVRIILPVGGWEDTARWGKGLIEILTTFLAFMSGWVFASFRDWLRHRRDRARAVSFYEQPAGRFASTLQAVDETQLRPADHASLQRQLDTQLKEVEDTIERLLGASWTLSSLKGEFFARLLEEKRVAQRLRASLPFTLSPADSVHFLSTMNRNERVAAWRAEHDAVRAEVATLRKF